MKHKRRVSFRGLFEFLVLEGGRDKEVEKEYKTEREKMMEWKKEMER